MDSSFCCNLRVLLWAEKLDWRPAGPAPAAAFIVFCHSSRALSPGGHGCCHCESVTAGQARGLEGGLGSLFSAERARVDFFLCGSY